MKNEVVKIEKRNTKYDKQPLFKPFQEIKICIVGDSGTGKTSLINRYLSDVFSRSKRVFETDVFVISDFSLIYKNVRGRYLKISLLDVNPNDEYTNSGFSYTTDCDVFIYTVALDAVKSLDHLESWVKKFETFAPNAIKILAATKLDSDARMMTTKRLESVCNQLGIRAYSEVSSRDDINVSELFETAFELGLGSENFLTVTEKSKLKNAKINLQGYVENQIKRLETIKGEKYSSFLQHQNKIANCQNLKELVDEVTELKKVAIQHRDTGIVGFFKFTWARKPQSYNELEDTLRVTNLNP